MLQKTKLFSIGILAIFLTACASSQDKSFKTSYKDGVTAYQQGNYQLAYMHWLPLAKKGNKFAQFGIGNMYDQGQGMPQNHKKAFNWYLQSAKQGMTSAQTNLSRLYAKGEGVERNYELCYVWANLAATSGLEQAVKNREECKKKLDTDELTDAQELAEKYWEKYTEE